MGGLPVIHGKDGTLQHLYDDTETERYFSDGVAHVSSWDTSQDKSYSGLTTSRSHFPNYDPPNDTIYAYGYALLPDPNEGLDDEDLVECVMVTSRGTYMFGKKDLVAQGSCEAHCRIGKVMGPWERGVLTWNNKPGISIFSDVDAIIFDFSPGDSTTENMALEHRWHVPYPTGGWVTHVYKLNRKIKDIPYGLGFKIAWLSGGGAAVFYSTALQFDYFVEKAQPRISWARAVDTDYMDAAEEFKTYDRNKSSYGRLQIPETTDTDEIDLWECSEFQPPEGMTGRAILLCKFRVHGLFQQEVRFLFKNVHGDWEGMPYWEGPPGVEGSQYHGGGWFHNEIGDGYAEETHIDRSDDFAGVGIKIQMRHRIGGGGVEPNTPDMGAYIDIYEPWIDYTVREYMN